MPTPTTQKVFDKVVAHLWNQRKRAVNDQNDCLYRGPNGTKCAVGALIPDSVYRPEFEMNDVDSLIAKFEDKLPKSILNNKVLLMDLQAFHDAANNNLTNMRQLNKGLAEIASNHELIYVQRTK